MHWAGRPPLGERHSGDYAETEDGFHIRLDRFEPAGPRADAPPALLVHGTCECGDAWRIGADTNLVRFLSERGLDVWTMDMRGSGRSSRPTLLGNLPDRWGFDAYALRDLPAAVGRVRERTGAPAVSVVGHSLGGMIAYALLARRGEDAGIDRVAALGSPMGLSEEPAWHVRALLEVFLFQARLIPPLRWSNCAPLSQWGAPWLRLFDPPGLGVVWNADNADAAAKSDFLAHGVGDTNPGAIETFGRMAETGEVVGEDGFVYSSAESLSRVKAPALVVAGADDRLARPEAVRRVFDALGSREKRFVLLGRDRGFSADYGHVDLLIGRAAARDLFPILAEFLGAAP